jgi:hypothetical protein
VPSSHVFLLRLLLPTSIGATLAACAGVGAAPVALSDPHRAALEDTLRAFVGSLIEAENQLDAGKAAGYSDDEDLALAVVGQEEYEMSSDSLKRGLAAGYAQVDSNVQVLDRVRARVFTADVGSIVAHGRSRVYLKDGSVRGERSTGTFLVMRRRTGWKIVQSHITAEPDTIGR